MGWRDLFRRRPVRGPLHVGQLVLIPAVVTVAPKDSTRIEVQPCHPGQMIRVPVWREHVFSAEGV